ncbi:unnamed protein product [Calypogeia fissa]
MKKEKSKRKGSVFPTMGPMTAEAMEVEFENTGLMDFLKLAILVPSEKICMDIEKGIQVGPEGVHLMAFGVTISFAECGEALRLPHQDLGFAPTTPADLLSSEKVAEWILDAGKTLGSKISTSAFKESVKHFGIKILERTLLHRSPNSFSRADLAIIEDIKVHPDQALGWWRYGMSSKLYQNSKGGVSVDTKLGYMCAFLWHTREKQKEEYGKNPPPKKRKAGSNEANSRGSRLCSNRDPVHKKREGTGDEREPGAIGVQKGQAQAEERDAISNKEPEMRESWLPEVGADHKQGEAPGATSNQPPGKAQGQVPPGRGKGGKGLTKGLSQKELDGLIEVGTEMVTGMHAMGYDEEVWGKYDHAWVAGILDIPVRPWIDISPLAVSVIDDLREAASAGLRFYTWAKSSLTLQGHTEKVEKAELLLTLGTFREDLMKAKAQVAALEASCIQDLRKAEAQVAALKASREEGEREAAQLKAQVASLEASHKQGEREAAHLKAKVASLETSLEEGEGEQEAAHLKAKVASLEAKVASLEASLEEGEREAAKLKSYISIYEARMKIPKRKVGRSLENIVESAVALYQERYMAESPRQVPGERCG